MRMNIELNTRETEMVKGLVTTVKKAAAISGLESLAEKGKAFAEKTMSLFGIKKRMFGGNIAQEIDTTNGIKYSMHISTKSFCAIIESVDLAVTPAFSMIRDMIGWSNAATEVLDAAEVKSHEFVDHETNEISIFIGENVEAEMLSDIEPSDYAKIYLGNRDNYCNEASRFFSGCENVVWGYDLDKIFEERYGKPEAESEDK